GRQPSRRQQLFVRRNQITVFIQVPDHQFGRRRHLGAHRQRPQLPHQVVSQGRRPRQKVFKRRFLYRLHFPLAAVTGVQVVLEKGAKIYFVKGIFLFRLHDRFVGGGHPITVLLLAGHLVQQGNRGIHLLQDRVLHDLGIDHVLELKLVERKHADHLHQARRQDLLLRDLQVQFWLE